MKQRLARLAQLLWPRSLKGQMLLAVALALLFAQSLGAFLLYRAQHEMREAGMIHAAAFRLLSANRNGPPRATDGRRFDDRVVRRDGANGMWSLRLERTSRAPLQPGERRQPGAEADLRRILDDQFMDVADVVVVHRPFRADRHAQDRINRRNARLGRHAGPPPESLLVAAVRQPGNATWLVTRVVIPTNENLPLLTLVGQTVFIYIVLVGAIAFILRRITRPLAALAQRLDRFAETRDPQGQLEPQGPDDLRRLIVAHNAMEGRIAALLDEKDVMLGAIGHDLKTPLAALRVRIESVEDDTERARMAATIEDIVRSLDDILSLARVGRPTDPIEPTELSALIASVAEEFEDMGEPVTLEDTVRVVRPLRATWLRRAVRNLVGNALRYGKVARVSLARDGADAVIRVDDDGPGIAPADIVRMMEPFTRGDPSRNSETGGAGLGLTLARAIAEQHGGALALANRHDASGRVTGLTATIRLPV